MYELILKALSELQKIFLNLQAQKDLASLAGRRAIALTQSYLGDLMKGMETNRDKEKEIALAWAEAASKVRDLAPHLEKEFQEFSQFWALGMSTDKEGLFEKTERLLDSMRGKKMRIPS